MLHLNLQIWTVWLPAVWQLFPAFSKGVWRCPSLFNTFIFLTYTVILTSVFFTNWAKALKILIRGKTNHTLLFWDVGHTSVIQWKLQAFLKILAYPIFLGWLKSVNISVEKIYLKNCRGILLIPSISNYFFCFQGPLVKQTISLVVECNTPTESIKLIKRAISGYLLNLMKCFLVVLEQVSFFMLIIASVTLSLFFCFLKLLGNCQYWQAHLHIIVNSEYYCTFSVNTLLWIWFGLVFLFVSIYTLLL